MGLGGVPDRRPCKGVNGNVCVAEGCYGEACTAGAAHASAHMQWRNAGVCLDITCHCGAEGHVDAESVGAIGCPDCGAVFKPRPEIVLEPTAEELPVTWMEVGE